MNQLIGGGILAAAFLAGRAASESWLC